MKYIKNKNIQITFTIREDLYFRFKIFCKGEKKNPANGVFYLWKRGRKGRIRNG